MERVFYFRVGIISIFFLILVIIGCNLTVERLSAITGQEIGPFLYASIADSYINLDFIGHSHQISILALEGQAQLFKEYIQNSWGNVQLTVAPRIAFISEVWKLGLDQLHQDLIKVVNRHQ